jgi:hypothetical protein
VTTEDLVPGGVGKGSALEATRTALGLSEARPPDPGRFRWRLCARRAAASGFAFGEFAFEVDTSVGVEALLGDAGGVENPVDARVAAEVQPVAHQHAAAYTGSQCRRPGAAPSGELRLAGEPARVTDFDDQRRAAIGPIPDSSRSVVPCSSRRQPRSRSSRRTQHATTVNTRADRAPDTAILGACSFRLLARRRWR